MDIAIITGASSGLGREYARRVSEKWKEIEEIWIIARRKEKLEEIHAILPKCRPMPFDLTDEESLSSLEQTLKEEKPRVRLLINAAGRGKFGSYREVSRAESAAMIDLNCRSAVEMTSLVLPYMGRGDRIMQICSTAAFQPFQGLSVYAASKAFLYRYSRALRVELLSRSISVTAVCPYWIRDTEFIRVAKKSEAGKPLVRHFILASRCRSVVALSLFDARHRFAVSTPGPICLLHRIVAKFVPSEIMMGLWAIIRRL